MAEGLESMQVRGLKSAVEPRTRHSAAAYGLVATAAFCLLVVGSNIPGPLLPVYRDRLELSTFTVTALFAVYLVGLVVTFTVVARTGLPAHATRVLPAAVVVCLVGDLALLAGSEAVAWLFVGRILVGVSVGLGTGSTATIVLATRGERGRAIAATGTLLGSFLGLVASAAVADLLPAPTTTIYCIHATWLAVTAVALVAAHRRSRGTVTRLILAPDETRPSGLTHPATRRSTPRLRMAGIALGAAGWAIGGIVVGLLPTVVTDMTGSGSITVTSLTPIVLIGVACIAPRVVGSLPSPVAAGAIAVGAGLCFVGVWAESLSTIFAACVMWGVGQGFAYANGLRIVAAGVLPVEQGRVASQYASIAYGFTGVVAVTTGWIATAAGTVSGVGFAGVVFAALSAAAVALGFRRWPQGR